MFRNDLEKPKGYHWNPSVWWLLWWNLRFSMHVKNDTVIGLSRISGKSTKSGMSAQLLYQIVELGGRLSSLKVTLNALKHMNISRSGRQPCPCQRIHLTAELFCRPSLSSGKILVPPWKLKFECSAKICQLHGPKFPRDSFAIATGWHSLSRYSDLRRMSMFTHILDG